jgi:hypothetical protein
MCCLITGPEATEPVSTTLNKINLSSLEVDDLRIADSYTL